jgi:hypothetical protein
MLKKNENIRTRMISLGVHLKNSFIQVIQAS